MKSIKKSMSGMVRSEKGFTLIEIIAVLVVLAILAAVAIPRYGAIQDKARDKAIVGALTELKGRCSIAYAGLLIDNNGNAGSISGANIISEVAASAGWDVGPDFTSEGGTALGTTGVTVTATLDGRTQTATYEP